MQNNYTKLLFATPLYQINLKQKNNLLKDLLISKIEQQYKDFKLNPPPGWLTNKVYTSFNQKDLNERIFSDDLIHDKLMATYHEHFLKVFGKEYNFLIQDMWFNYYINGEYQESHDHVGDSFSSENQFSAIHFLKFDPKRHQPVIFENPCKINRPYIPSDNYIPSINEGDLFIFPSHLEHYVKQSEPTPDYARITIAFNIKVEENGN